MLNFKALLLIICISTGLVAQEKVSIKFGIRKSPAPYYILNNGKLVDGVMKDLSELLAKELNYELEYVLTNLNSRVEKLNNSELDIVCGWRPRTSELKDSLQWSIPFFQLEDVFHYLKDQHLEISHIDNVINMKIGTIAGHSYPYLKEKIYNEDVELFPTRWTSSNIKRLLSKVIDSFIGSKFVTQYKIKSLPQSYNFAISTMSYNKRFMHCAIAKKGSKINLDQLNKALKKIIDNGKFNNFIMKKYTSKAKQI